MLRTLSWLALVLILTLPVSAQGDRDKPVQTTIVVGDGVIVPGRRVGPVALGMSTTQILKVMPSGYERDEFPEQKIILYEWRKQGFWVSTDLQSKIRVISVFGNSDYHTDKGVYLLNPESKLVAVYGSDFKRYEYPKDRVTLIRYIPLGLQFGLANDPSNHLFNGRIFQIGIFEPGKELPLAEAPGK